MPTLFQDEQAEKEENSNNKNAGNHCFCILIDGKPREHDGARR
jgi:hypothetical protein